MKKILSLCFYVSFLGLMSLANVGCGQVNKQTSSVAVVINQQESSPEDTVIGTWILDEKIVTAAYEGDIGNLYKSQIRILKDTTNQYKINMQDQYGWQSTFNIQVQLPTINIMQTSIQNDTRMATFNYQFVMGVSENCVEGIMHSEWTILGEQYFDEGPCSLTRI